MNSRIAVLVFVAIAASLPTSVAHAQATNPSYLREMPPVKRVMTEIQGTDAMDTAARQMGAFWQLQQIIEDLAGPRRWRNQLTPDEKRLIGEYRGGYTTAGKPYEEIQNSPSHPDKPKWYKLHAGYETDRAFRDELLKRFLSPTLRAQYAKATADTARTDQEREERDKKAMAATKAQAERNAQAAKEALANPPPDVQEYMRRREKRLQWQRALARCMASGRSEIQCFVEAIGRDLTQMMNPLLSNTPPPAGLTLSGAYSGQGDFSIWFYPDYAIVGCNGVQAEAGYALDRKGDQFLIRLLPSPRVSLIKINENLAKFLPGSSNPDEWQNQRIVLTLRSDGKMAGPNSINVTGPVAVGQKTQQTTETKEKTLSAAEARNYNPVDVHRTAAGGFYVNVEEPVTKNVPVYASRTASCTPGILSPTGPSPVAGSISTLTAMALNLASGGGDKSAGKMPPPGLRMNGKYVGQPGFDIEFFPECAVLACREVVVGRDYSVSTTGDKVLVKIQNSAQSIQLELRPDGTLVGSGSVEVAGRVLADVNENNEPIFKSATDTSVLGVLTPTQTGSAATQPTSSATSSAPIPTGTAVLSLASGFATQPDGKNPLAGKTFYLLKDSAEAVLTRGGIRLQPETSAFKSWLIACSNGTPECQQGQTAIDANSATLLKTDASGNGRFVPVSPGTYYVMGITRFGDELLLWDLKVDLKPGANAVTLDQRNGTPIK